MARHTRTFLILITALCFFQNTLNAADITYEIGEINLPGGHIVTGSITTNGTIGDLSGGEITSFDISVAGPSPYNFDSTATIDHITIDAFRLHASETELTTDEALWIEFTDSSGTNTPPDCTTCNLSISWEAFSFYSVEGAVRYRFADLDDFNPSLEDKLVLGGSDVTTIVIGTAIPEPSTCTLTLVIALGIGISRRRSRNV